MMAKYILIVVLFASQLLSLHAQDKIVIGSKRFPESRILAEIMSILIEEKTDIIVDRRFYLGGTLICFGALQEGALDIYPEYTGTLWVAILKKNERFATSKQLYDEVKNQLEDKFKLTMLPPFGFNNTYVMATSQNLNITKISELKDYKKPLKFGHSNEFLKRPDGFPGLCKHYNFSFDNVVGMEHGLIYKALEEGQINVTDAYSTDGKLEKYKLKTLEDDLGFFPPYYGVATVRQDTLKKHPEVEKLLLKLSNTIDDEKMRRMNYRVEVMQEDFYDVAYDFLAEEGFVERNTLKIKAWRKMFNNILPPLGQHLLLTLVSTLMAISVGIPLGLFIAKYNNFAGVVLGVVGVIQTIPSLALLAFMIPIFQQIGFWPAVYALSLYSLLPIVRNTYTGIIEVDPQLKEAAKAMGMTSGQILWQLELPMSTKVIMAGIRTAVVINIGTATLAAFIGGGGLGELIISGLSLNNTRMTLSGAIPAACLALVVDYLLGRVENWVEPTGLQIQRNIQK